MALKNDDSRAFPLCKGPDGCHASLHNPYQKGQFKGWKKSALKLWQRAMADLYSTAVHGQEEGQGGTLQGEEGHDVDPWGEIF